jgi:hypothetical protein
VARWCRWWGSACTATPRPDRPHAERSPLRIEVITTWHDQAALAPHFLDHYRYADRITVIVEAGTDDQTLAICARYPNVAVDHLPAGAGDAERLARLNATYRALRCDWVYAVEGHELLFRLPWGTNPRPAMNLEHDFDVVRVRLWRVHRHRSDADLDPRRPAVPQRRHGEPHLGEQDPPARPLVVRGGFDGAWTGGRQSFERAGGGGLRESPRVFGGVDWSRADQPPGPGRDQHLDDPQLF